MDKLEEEILEHIEYNGFYLANKLINQLPESKQPEYRELIQKKMEELDKGLLPLSSGI